MPALAFVFRPELRFFPIVAFIIAITLSMSYVNTLNIFNASAGTPATISNGQQLNAQYLEQVAGCSGVNATTGSGSCSASPGPSSSTGGGILGSIAGTVLVFGNFIAAVQFLAQMGTSASFPYFYLVQWGMDPSLAAIFNALVWFCYACEIFYLVSGRPINY